MNPQTIMLDILYLKGVRKLLVEGGGTIIWNFLKERLVDELFVYIGSCIIGGKNSPTLADGAGIKNEDELIPLKIIDVSMFDSGILVHYKVI